VAMHVLNLDQKQFVILNVRGHVLLRKPRQTAVSDRRRRRHTYTPRGKLNFARLIGSTGQDAAAGIHIDPKSGNFYLAGAFDGPVDFDPGRSGVFVMDTGRHAEPSDLFVATYTHLGAFINAAQLGAPGTIETPISFSLAPSGRVYVLGKSESSGGSESISLFDTIR